MHHKKTTNNKMSISIMKIICIVLSLSLLIGATVDQGEEWKDGPLTKVQDSPMEDDTFSDTYQPLDEPAEYQQDNTPQQDTIQSDQQEETDTITNGVESQDGSCKCNTQIKTALLQSLQSCINVINAMETCTSRNKRSVDVHMQLISSCGCSDKMNNELIKSLKSCTDALFTSSSCTHTISRKKVKAYSSCAEIKRDKPRSASGYYKILVNNRNVSVYCHMGTLCGVGGGWTRLGKLDMTISSTRCPSTLILNTVSGTRLCTKNDNKCQSVPIPSQGIRYSQVCGRVRGYHKQSLDGFNTGRSIDTNYVDGVSITRGSPRKHIWSLGSGITSRCPCSSTSRRVPSFVGSDHYCESGFATSYKSRFSVNDILWDGKNCPTNEARCCTPPLLPWFLKRIGSTTTDNIEMRLCTDEGPNNENIGIDQYEFYVK